MKNFRNEENTNKKERDKKIEFGQYSKINFRLEQIKYKEVIFVLKVISLLGMYFFCVYNYINYKICVNRGTFIFFNIAWSIILLSLNYDINIHNEKIKRYIKILEVFFMPLISVLVVESMCNSQFSEMRVKYIFLNYLLVLLVEVFFAFFLGEKTGLYIVSTMAFIFGMINYFVIKFKGMPFMPTDLFAINTAADVAGQYQFFIADSVVLGYLLYMVQLCLIKYVEKKEWKKKARIHYVKKSSFFFAFFIMSFWLYKVNYNETFDIQFNAWDPLNSYNTYGSLFAFFLEAQQLRIDKVNGYSVSGVENILNRYEDISENATTMAPNIIIIMNESFSDLSVLGNINTEEYLNNWKNVDYIMRGNAYASQYGGGTCNTEFEVLTGSTMTFIPNGSYPYQNYSLKRAENLIKVFKSNNYSCIAMHPAQAKNWNRGIVYDDLGFDEFLDLNDFNGAEHYQYVTDNAVYQKIVERIRNEETPTIIFAVTMQNHGPYVYGSQGNIELVKLEDDFSKYDYAVTYMTLIKKSDEAFGNLVDYTMNLEEPTIVCMFGDHQPNLGDDFYDYLISTDRTDKDDIEKEVSKYIVPYIIFSNYDMGVSGIEEDLSLNYLGALLLKLVGYETPYFEFINEMEEKIPIINLGRYMTNDYIWHDVTEENNYLNEYEMIQYYNLFERK